MTDAPSKKRLGRARRATRAVAAAVGLAAVFAGAAAGGLALHLDLPATRRLAARAIGAAASRAMLGTLTVDRIDQLGFGGIEGATVTVRDPSGNAVLTADGIRIRAPLGELLRSADLTGREITLAIPHVRVEHADVTLEPDATGELGVVRAFSPPEPSETPPSPSATPRRAVRVWLPTIRVGHAWAHGRIHPVAGAELPIDVEVGNVSGAVLASATQVTIDAPRFGLVGRKLDVRYVAGEGATSSAEARGTAEVHLALPSASGAPLGGWGSFDGFIDDVQASARGQLDGARLEVTADLPRGDPASLRAIVPGLPVNDVVALHARAKGELPRLDVEARMELGAGELVATGPVTLDGDPRATLELRLRDVNARGIDPSWPSTSVTGEGRLEASLHPTAGLAGSFHLATEPATVETWVVPAGSLDGQFSKSGLDMKATVDVDGMPTTIDRLTVRGEDKGKGGVTVQFEAKGDVPALEKVPALRRTASGRAHWYARGSFAKGKLDAQVGVLLGNVRRGAASLRQAAIVGTVSGSPTDPWIDASIVAQQVFLGGVPFRNVRATAQGPALAPSIVATFENDRLPLVVARGTVRASAAGGVLIDRARLEASHGEVAVAASADRVTIDDRGLDVRAFQLEGAGEPLEGSLRVGPDAFALTAKGASLDVGRIASLFRAREAADEALVARKATAFRKAFPMLWSTYVDGTRASLDLDVEHGRAGDRARLTVDVDNRGGAALPGLHARLDGSLEGRSIGGSGFTLELGDVLSIALVPTVVTLAGDPLDEAAWRDATGQLALRSTLDLDKIAERLPATLMPMQRVGGTLSTRIALTRSADRAPDVDLAVTTKGLSLLARPVEGRDDDAEPEPPWELRGLDLSLTGSLSFASDRARIRAVATEGQRELAVLVAEAEPPFEKLFGNPSRARELLSAAPLTVQLRVPRTAVQSLPVALRPTWFAGDVELAADLNGSLAMPIVTFDVGGYGLVSRRGGDLPLVAGAYATYGFGETDLHLDVSQPDGGSISMSSTLRAPLEELLTPPDRGGGAGAGYGERLVDYLLATDADARIQAASFRLAAFQPMLEGIVAHLDGKLDGSVRIHQAPGEGGPTRTLDGSADVSHGVFQFPEIGQEFRDATARLTADGGGVVKVASLSAEGSSGRLTGHGEISLPNLELEEAKASLDVAQNERVPLTLEGVSFGDAWGQLEATLRRGDYDGRDAMRVSVDVKQLHTELPESSARDVQPLADDPKIRVGTWDGARFSPILLAPSARAGASMPWVFDFRLGDVTVKRGAEMNLAMTGTPTVVLTDRAHVSGDVQLTGGSIDVLGKRFEIDHGTVLFNPNDEPGNPFVAVTARWDAPDATRVYADYVGPMRTAKLTLRSEPARSELELDQLVLFGTTDSDGAGVTPTQSTPSGAQAAGIGGSVATAGLNRVLSGATGAAITTRVDTSVAQNPKPEVAVRLSDTVTAEIAYALGTGVLGQSDRVLVTVGWHFRQRWALSTTVGDRGTSLLDLIWQYRY